MQYRIPLEGGQVLVLTLEVEEADPAQLEPENIGAALLNALGLGGASRPTAKRPARSHQTPEQKAANEENPDTWLRRTSEQSYGQKFSRKTRAEGDTED